MNAARGSVLISVHNKTIQINYSRKAKERAELNIHGESIVKVAHTGRVCLVSEHRRFFKLFAMCAKQVYVFLCLLAFVYALFKCERANEWERERTNYSQMTPMYLCGGTLWLLI